MSRRRTIETTFRELYGGFCGWKTLCRTMEGITNEDGRIIFNGIFQLGCRALELPTLHRRQVDLDSDDECIWIRSMEVEKHRAKEYIDNVEESQGRHIYKDAKGMFILLPTVKHRTFPIMKDNPLSKIFIDHVEKISPEDKIYPYTYGQISYRICLIDTTLPQGYYEKGWWYCRGPWWPHRIRAERACQLRRDYKYDAYSLKKFFGWATTRMPDVYVDMLPLDLKVEMIRNKGEWR